MTQHEPKLKIPGLDIEYPVINDQHQIMGVTTWDILDDDRDLICSCTSPETAVIITGLLNEHKPNEWKR